MVQVQTDVLGWLRKKQAEGKVDFVQTASVGRAFENKGYFGPITAMHYFKGYSEEDIAIYASDFENMLGYVPDSGKNYWRSGNTNSWFYYFKDESIGKSVMVDMFKNKYSPRSCWRFEIMTQDLLGVDVSKFENWGEVIGDDATITGLFSKSRHEFNFLTLPSVVDAAARFAGHIKESIWNANELLSGMQEEEYTEGFEYRMIGQKSAKKDDVTLFEEILKAVDMDYELAYSIALGDNDEITVPDAVKDLKGSVAIHYTHSRLWQRRAALWKALGEDNPEVRFSIGYSDATGVANNKQLETTSPQLSECLGLEAFEWEFAIYGQLHRCPTPISKGTTKSGYRLTVPVVANLWKTKEECLAAAIEANGGDENATTASTPNTEQPSTITAPTSGPAIPTLWVTDPEEWKTAFAEMVQQTKGTPNILRYKKIRETLQVEDSDIDAWLPLYEA